MINTNLNGIIKKCIKNKDIIPLEYPLECCSHYNGTGSYVVGYVYFKKYPIIICQDCGTGIYLHVSWFLKLLWFLFPTPKVYLYKMPGKCADWRLDNTYVYLRKKPTSNKLYNYILVRVSKLLDMEKILLDEEYDVCNLC